MKKKLWGKQRHNWDQGLRPYGESLYLSHLSLCGTFVTHTAVWPSPHNRQHACLWLLQCTSCSFNHQRD